MAVGMAGVGIISGRAAGSAAHHSKPLPGHESLDPEEAETRRLVGGSAASSHDSEGDHRDDTA